MNKLFYQREREGYKISEEIDREEIVNQLVDNENWISEGVYKQKWLNKILTNADFVFLLKVPKYLRHWRTTKRTIRQILKIEGYRPASLKLIFDFYRFNNKFEKERYQEIDERLGSLKVEPIIIESFEQIDNYLSTKH